MSTSSRPRYTLPLEPQDTALLYHTTTEDAVDILLDNGIRTTECDYVQTEHDVLEYIADQHDFSMPVDRRNVSFWWPSVEPVNHLNTTKNDDLGGLQATTLGVIAAFDAVPTPVYVADMNAMSDLIDACTMTGVTPPFDSHDHPSIEAAEAYLTSIERADSWSAVKQAAAQYDYPEVLVPNDVPPDAIVATYTT